MTIPELYCRQLKKTKSDGTFESVAVSVLTLRMDVFFFDDDDGDENVLIEILCTMTNSEIRKVFSTYHKMFGKKLEQGIREDKNGNFKRLLKILSEGSRDETTAPDLKAAMADAEILLKNFQQPLPNKPMVIDMLCTKSYAQVKLISEEYQKLAGDSLEMALKKHTDDHLKKSLLAIVRYSTNPSHFYARCLNKAIDNYDLDSSALGRLIVARCEIDLMDIKEEFNRTFRKNIKKSLKEEVEGSYKYAVLTLLGEN